MAIKKTFQSASRSALKAAAAPGQAIINTVGRVANTVRNSMPSGSRPGEMGGNNAARAAAAPKAVPNLPFKKEPLKRQSQLKQMIDEL